MLRIRDGRDKICKTSAIILPNAKYRVMMSCTILGIGLSAAIIKCGGSRFWVLGSGFWAWDGETTWVSGMCRIDDDQNDALDF